MSNELNSAEWSELSSLGLASNAPDGDWKLDIPKIRQLVYNDLERKAQEYNDAEAELYGDEE